jgi:hypothetical protein
MNHSPLRCNTNEDFVRNLSLEPGRWKTRHVLKAAEEFAHQQPAETATDE